MSFAAITKVGIEKSEEIKRELEKNNCLTKKNTFKKSPAHSEFRHQCLDNFEAVKDFAPATLERVHQFMKELYHPSDYIPYYDKEIYNFIEARDKEGPKGKSDPGP